MNASVLNVLRGWMGLAPPTPGRQRSISRGAYRKTTRRQAAPRLISRLEAAGCEPRQVADGLWFALCPTCRGEGRHAVVEIRRSADGSLAMACSDAHEGRRAA